MIKPEYYSGGLEATDIADSYDHTSDMLYDP